MYNGSYELFHNLTLPDAQDPYNKGVAAIAGIKCGDSALRIDDVAEIGDLIAQQLNVSHWFPLHMTTDSLGCTAWKTNAAGRYTGDFNVATKNPVLLINNAWDNITPLVSAQNTSAGLEGSVVLVQNSYGVGSMVSTF